MPHCLSNTVLIISLCLALLKQVITNSIRLTHEEIHSEPFSCLQTENYLDRFASSSFHEGQVCGYPLIHCPQTRQGNLTKMKLYLQHMWMTVLTWFESHQSGHISQSTVYDKRPTALRSPSIKPSDWGAGD